MSFLAFACCFLVFFCIHCVVIRGDELSACRDSFRTVQHLDGGGYGEFTVRDIKARLKPYDIKHLVGFTGLSSEEVLKRLQRTGRFHFVGEQKFWNPESETESRWFYRSSITYLFANIIHDQSRFLHGLTPSDGPVLDYSGGTGNNIIYLAGKKIQCVYFGIGLLEYAFTQYRLSEMGLSEWVTFLQPYSAKSNWQLDSALTLPRDGSLGTILAFDVLEHVHHYELVVAAMVESLRPGGCIIESSPFEKETQNTNSSKIRIHLTNGGIRMKEAMGPAMTLARQMKFGTNSWCKKV